MLASRSGLLKTRKFLDHSTVEAFVPETSEIDWSTIINSGNASRRNGLTSLGDFEQRRLLFLDEVVTVSVVLQAPFEDEEDFKGHLERLTITVEASAVGSVRPRTDDQEQQPAPVKDQLDLQKLEDLGDPLVVIEDLSENTQSSPKSRIYCIWTVDLHLSRTKIRSSNPSVFFSVAVGLDQLASAQTVDVEDDYLPSGVAGSINVLEALSSIPSLKDNPPTLSAAKLSKIIPTNLEGTDLQRPLRNANPTLLRVGPAVNSRVRCSRVGASATQAKVLASLDLEISSLTKHDVALDSMQFTLSGGRAEPIGSLKNLSFPLTCRPRDSLSFVYNLLPNESHLPAPNHDPMHTLTFSLTGTVTHSDGSSLPFKVAWRNQVDLTALLTPTAIIPPPKQLLATTNPAPDDRLASPPSNALHHLVTLTVTSHASTPTLPLGCTLRWTLLLTNRSATRTLRLAVIPITHSTPSSTTDHPRHHPPQASNAQQHVRKPTLPTSAFAAAPNPSPPPPAADRSPAPPPPPPPPQQAAQAPGLIPLTPDLRVGPLAPGACATAEMRFLVAGEGLVGLRALRVADLEAGEGNEDGGEKRVEWVDVAEGMLPWVVGVEGDEGTRGAGIVE